MKRILLVIAILMLGPEAGAGHELLFAQNNDRKVSKPIVKESGWKIPALEESRVTDARKLLPKGYGPASAPLHVTVLKPRREFITTIERYGLKDGQALVIAERRVAIDSIIKVDASGRVFMYILHCTIVLEEPDGRTGYSGVFGIQYSDRDGDGKFESFEEGPPFVTSDLRIPDWVLKNPSSATEPAR